MLTSAGVPRATPRRGAEYEQKLNDEKDKFSVRLSEERHDLLE